MQKENTTNKGGNLDQPNVTESLALAGPFRKVSVKERLPQDYIFCDTDKGRYFYDPKFQMFYDSHDVEYPIDWINYWFEEIKLPSIAEMKLEAGNFAESQTESISITLVGRRGAISMGYFWGMEAMKRILGC